VSGAVPGGFQRRGLAVGHGSAVASQGPASERLRKIIEQTLTSMEAVRRRVSAIGYIPVQPDALEAARQLRDESDALLGLLPPEPQ
jgi:hypothetical protein